MFAVAIDGPSGAGKSTIAQIAAERLGFIYVDTGALYRCIGLYLVNHGIDPMDSAAVCSALLGIRVEMRHTKAGQRVYLGGEDVSEQIRTPKVTRATSKASAIPEVRSFLLRLQTDIAAKNNVIMDGRDIGTVVLPDAKVKLFLTATPQERARRRCLQMQAGGMQADYEAVLRDILERDDRDTRRDTAPLRPAPEAITIDSTGRTQEQIIDEVVGLIQDALAQTVGEP